MSVTPHAAFRARAHFPSLDGLRCLSILPVVWHHSTPRPLDGVLGKGPLGVHLFFAISGFLITTLLLREREQRGKISLPKFYQRRALRIFPLYYLVLAIYALRGWLFLPESPLREHFLRSLPYYATYTGNWFVDYGVPHPVVFGFSWSLATEAQFYLVWPPIVALSRGWKVPAAFMLGLFALDFATESGWLAGLFGRETLAVQVVTSLSAPICLGSLLAMGLHWPASFRWLEPLLGRAASAPLWLAALALAIGLDAPLLLIHVAMVLLAGAVCMREDHALARGLDARVPRFIGEVSYGIYLFHVSVITASKWLLPGAGAPLLFVVASAGSVALAALSYRWFEGPFLRLAARMRRGGTAGVVGAALAAALLLWPGSARGDTFGVQAHWLRGTTNVHQLELSVAPGQSEPAALHGRRPRLWGHGTLEGVDLRADVLLEATRLGGALAFFVMDDLSVRTHERGAGGSAKSSSIWGGNLEAFVGQEIGQGPVYPYLDLRGTFSLVQVDIETPSDTSAYLGWRVGLGPRFGVLIPVGHSSVVDIAIHQRLVGGVEQTTFALGLGYWENDRRDEFSQFLRGHPWRGQI